MLNRIIRMITNNFGLKILAVVFAGVLWLAVVNIDDPVTTRSFPRPSVWRTVII